MLTEDWIVYKMHMYIAAHGCAIIWVHLEDF